jgi:hypothetical protein
MITKNKNGGVFVLIRAVLERAHGKSKRSTLV